MTRRRTRTTSTARAPSPRRAGSPVVQACVGANGSCCANRWSPILRFPGPRRRRRQGCQGHSLSRGTEGGSRAG
jgi:hypothetical protein